MFMQEFLDEKPAPTVDKRDDLFGAILQYVDKNKKQLYRLATIMTCFDPHHHHLHAAAHASLRKQHHVTRDPIL